MTAATAKQIGAIHAMKARLRLSDDEYRAVLQAETGKRSSKDLSTDAAGRVIDKLKVWTNPAAPAERSVRPVAAGAVRLDGTYAGVCRVLWIAAYNLGVTRDRTDKAMVAFVARQTGIAHLNWVRESADAKKVIEALKSWIARETGITWDASAKNLALAGLTLTRWRKLEVLRAQMRRLEGAGQHGPFPPRRELDGMSDAALDQLSAELGRQLRKALKRRT